MANGTEEQALNPGTLSRLQIRSLRSSRAKYLPQQLLGLRRVERGDMVGHRPRLGAARSGAGLDDVAGGKGRGGRVGPPPARGGPPPRPWPGGGGGGHGRGGRGGGCLSSRVLAGGARVWHSQGAPSPRRGAPPSVRPPSLLWRGGPYPAPPPEGTETTFPVLSFGALSLPYTELEDSAGLECVSGSLVDKQNPDSSPPKGGGKGLCCEEARTPGG